MSAADRKTALLPEHRRYLNEAAVSDAVIDAAGVYSVSKLDELPDDLATMPTLARALQARPLIVFPWTDGHRVIPQAKTWLDEPKYLQGKGSGSVLWRLRPSSNGHPHLMVEGSKQSLSAASCAPEGWGVSGMLGHSGWSRNDLSWLSDLDVVVVLDADASTNPQVWDGGTKLARELDGVAERVRFVRLRSAGKAGLDDVLAGMDEAKRTAWLVDEVKWAGLDLGRRPQAEVKSLMVDGASFVLDIPEQIPALWGSGSQVVWAEGESLMITAPPGLGKTTLAGQIVRARLGLIDEVLGMPIVPTGSKVLYLAMDRPSQIARSLRRHFTDDEREVLAERLVVWRGPPPADLAQHTGTLAEMAVEAGADTVILDSLKDAALGLEEPEVGGRYNRARQAALIEGVQLIELHHQTKHGANGRKPRSISDVYGSTWLTAGAGSVVLLWGRPGDLIVEWDHLKQPVETVGPMRVQHNHESGQSTVVHGTDARQIVDASGSKGVTATQVAAVMYGTVAPDRNQVEKARRRLDALVKAGEIRTREGPPRATGGKPETIYENTFASNHASNHAGGRAERQSRNSRAITRNDKTAGQSNHGSNHGNHAADQSRSVPPLEGHRRSEARSRGVMKSAVTAVVVDPDACPECGVRHPPDQPCEAGP